uniref:Protein tyrosine phosphatase type IVA 3 n=1 Tax=Varanus komodoensis TaxID=61221 RepID=A0A8D2JGX4_VARKO
MVAISGPTRGDVPPKARVDWARLTRVGAFRGRPLQDERTGLKTQPAPIEVPAHSPALRAIGHDLKKYGATTVVRVCEVTYDKTPLEQDGITVMDWPFDDGAPPPSKIVDDWLNLLKTKFCEDPGCCVAVHCVAGLGRAPVLVALALIESGMKYEDAIQFIRHWPGIAQEPPLGAQLPGKVQSLDKW